MKAWKWWTGTSVLFVIAVGVSVSTALWQNFSTAWRAEQVAAQDALNESPLSHLTGHEIFTGAGLQEVFSGTDVFERPWYAFVESGQSTTAAVYAVPAVGLMTQTRINHVATATYQMHVVASHLGYFDENVASRFHVQPEAVWEIRGDIGTSTEYLYLNASNAKLVWRTTAH